MKIYWLLIALVACCFMVKAQTDKSGQTYKIDSLNKALQDEKTDTGKVKLLYNLSDAYEVYKPDSALLFGQESLLLARKIKYVDGEIRALDHMANAFDRIGDYPKAFEYYIEELKMDENSKNAYGIAVDNMNIASLYHQQADYSNALLYENIADSIIAAIKDEYLQMFNLLNKGDMYEKNNQLDSAMQYSTDAYNVAVKRGDTSMIGNALNNLGNVYSKKGDRPAAFNYYRMAMPYLTATRNHNFLCETNLGLARLFEEENNSDSALYYGKKAFEIASNMNFQSKTLDASKFLTDLYKKTGNINDAYSYMQVMINVKDSVESAERIKKLQIISIDEQLRQKELAALLQEENEERVEKIQWLGIGILIPVFFLLSIFLSKRKVHKKIIEFSGIVSLLLLFESLTLLLHPVVANTTHHSPVFEVLIFVCIAAIITPTHHRIEHWLVHKLTQINYLKHHRIITENNDYNDELTGETPN